jgi:hypothetical protein
MKKTWGPRLTTVFPRQGHYATDPEILATYPHGEIQLNRIADLVDHDFPTMCSSKQETKPGYTGSTAASAGTRY